MEKEQPSKKIYSYQEKKHIAQKIQCLKNKNMYIAIGKLIMNDIGIKKISSNSNGCFLIFNLVSDDTIEKIEKVISKSTDKLITKKKLSSNDIFINSDDLQNISKIDDEYDDDEIFISSSGPRLNNYEKNIIKMHRTNNVMNNNDNDVYYCDYNTIYSETETLKESQKEIKNEILNKQNNKIQNKNINNIVFNEN